MAWSEDDCTRVFMLTGTVAHLLSPLHSPNSFAAALCNASPNWPTTWLGTGDQNEHDKAAKLRLCKRCAVKVGA